MPLNRKADLTDLSTEALRRQVSIARRARSRAHDFHQQDVARVCAELIRDVRFELAIREAQ